MKHLNSLFFILIFSSLANCQVAENIWIDSLMSQWSEDQKLGQLFMIRAHSEANVKHVKAVEKLIKEEHIGGLCFFQGTPKEQAKLTNKFQKLSNTPLFISVDGEWGLGMRFKEHGFSFPRQLMLGAMEDNTLIYDMGKKVAEHCKLLGIHINFAPVVDVNNNPLNPVINDRSFGEDKYNVASKSYAYMKGMQDGGIMACAKHFPGHGDTDVDSHLDLPVITHDMNRLDSIELMPFKSIINQGIQSIMVAHLQVPALDNRPNRATTLSQKTVTELLKNKLGFQGLIFTDALEMKGVTKHFKPGQADAEALLAGNDILLLSEDVKKAKSTIKQYVKDGLISQQQIDQTVRKILTAKYQYGLYKTPVIENIDSIELKIKSTSADVLRRKLIEKSLTLIKNENQYIPIGADSDQTYGSIAFGVTKQSAFQKSLNDFVQADQVFCPYNVSASASDALYRQLSKHDVVFISLHDMSKYASKNFGISPSALTLIERLRLKTKVVLTIFGSPYSLKYFDKIPSILMAYENGDDVQDIACQSLFGVNEINGKLPVTADDNYKSGMGYYSPATGTMGYAIPEEVGLSSDSLSTIDSIIDEMITEKAAPGCQILVAKDGKIVFNKAFGYHTYEKKRKVRLSDLYDVASVTKILATTISVMNLEDEHKINIDNSLGQYITELDTCQNKELVIKDVMAHHAGLRGWIPFYKYTMTEAKKPKRIDSIYSDQPKENYRIEVARSVYMCDNYCDTIWNKIYSCSLRDTNDYKYSDLGYYMLSKIIHDCSNKPLDQFTNDVFYQPMGLKRTSFLPLKKYKREEMVPTEEDSYFRNQQLQGHVHDMGAAMLGGVSGHAGLFSNSHDIGLLMQMLLNGGTYAGKKYINEATVRKYTQRHPRSTRRGIGFDMKELNPDKTMNVSESISDLAFGHLGFTGISVYADPKYNMVVVFLANRTYPSMENNKFSKNEYRPRVQTAVYNALLNKN